MLAVVGNTRFSGEHIPGNDRAPDLPAQFDLWFVFAKFAAVHQQRSAVRLNGAAAFLVPIPLHKSAVAEADGAASGDFCNLVAWPPEGAIHETHHGHVVGFHPNHGWIGAVEGRELTTGNQQAKDGGIFNVNRGETIIRADAEEISIALPRLRIDELVAGVIAKTKGVEDIFPVRASEHERLAVFLLPLKQFRLHAPPRVEMDILDASNVVNGDRKSV